MATADGIRGSPLKAGDSGARAAFRGGAALSTVGLLLGGLFGPARGFAGLTAVLAGVVAEVAAVAAFEGLDTSRAEADLLPGLETTVSDLVEPALAGKFGFLTPTLELSAALELAPVVLKPGLG